MANIVDSLNSQIRNLQSQINQFIGEINTNNAKISRLKTAKNELKNHKDDAKNNLETFYRLVEGFDADSNWSGNRRDSVLTVLADYVKNDYSSYVERVDEALDAVCDEIARLENTNMSKFGSITWMQRRVNTLANEVRKYLN